MNIGIIGCGNMGSAIARGISNKAGSGDLVFVYDNLSERANLLAEETGYECKDLSSLICSSELVIIAVKPQDYQDLFSDIAPHITQQTILSVMAGVKMKSIIKAVGKQVPVVRAMPNMPAFIGQGITCICFNSLVENIKEVEHLLSGIGSVLRINENLMDSVTALSGSGPAYLFYLADSMIEAGIEMGIDADTAKKLVAQTL